jgi:hypothetical protein
MCNLIKIIKINKLVIVYTTLRIYATVIVYIN